MSDAAASDDQQAPVDDSVTVAIEAARLAEDKKAADVVVLDVGDVLSITGYFVVASAPNQRLVRTIAEEIEAGVRARLGRSPVRTEGMREQQWVLVDYGDVVVHVFHETQREFYAIERLYGDVPRVRWQTADDAAAGGDERHDADDGEADADPLSSGDDDR